MDRKIKVLAYCDSPAVETGFAQVSKQIFKSLSDTGKYDILVVGINHFNPLYDRKKIPYTIIGEKNDPYSSSLFVQYLINYDFDILFTLNDLGVIRKFIPAIREAKKTKDFRWITYSPIDADRIVKEAFESFEASDYPVSYTDFGYEKATSLIPSLSKKLSTIYHGCDEDFKPAGDKNVKFKYRQDLFKVSPDTFLVMNINRNQWRKDFWRTLEVFKKFKFQNGQEKNAKLYLHCKAIDEGGNIGELLHIVGLDPKDVLLVNIEEEAYGVPREDLNRIYNSVDVVISTTKSEGWGLTTTESFVCKVPVIMPNNTSLKEIVGTNEERGYLALSGATNSEWAVDYGKSNYPRPLTNIDSMVDKLNTVYEDWKVDKMYKGTPTGEKIESAFNWSKEHTWKKVNRQWVDLFDKASVEIL